MLETFCSRPARSAALWAALLIAVSSAAPIWGMQPAQEPAEAAQAAPRHVGGEASLVLPDLGAVDFQGINGRTLLMAGLGVCVLGLAFGMVIFNQLKNLPVHRSMREISELIYETCKTYLVTQGKFILLLEVFNQGGG
jgi:K(+)-stimulated pyrophosphate-energized sodium pump